MKIFGYVQDENGEPLSGGSIYSEKDKTIITEVSPGGAFILDSKEINSSDNFVISFDGFEEQIIAASQLIGKKILLKQNQLLNFDVKENKSSSANLYKENNSISFFSKNKTTIGVIGALTLITVSFFIIKKNI